MMSTERLKTIYRQEQNKRKFVCVMNDVTKSRQELYAGYIDKEKQEAVQKSNKSIVVTKRNIVRQRVLKHCMKNRREELEKVNAKKIYGQYNGVTVEQIAEEIDPCIQKNHPRNRRKQKIDSLFREGVAKGAILDDNTMHHKVLEYFERPLVAIHHVEADSGDAVIKEDNVVNKPKVFYTGDVQTVGKAQMQALLNRKHHEEDPSNISEDDTKEKLFVRRKVSKFLNDDVPDDLSVFSEAPPSDTLNKRGIRPVTLPPIKIGTDSEDVAANHTGPGAKNKDCISDLINRLHEAKDNREREIKVKKERRAKRLQHERVFGYGGGERELYTSQTARDYITKTPMTPRAETSDRKLTCDGLRLPPIHR